MTSVALVGVHGHGAVHLRRLRAAGVLVAVCDIQPADLDGIPQYSRLADLLAEHEPDAVIVTTPPHTHVPLAVEVLSAGRDLLLEKPAVLTTADLAVVAAAAREHGAVCQVGFQSVGGGAFRRLVEIVGSGELGRIRGIGAAGRWVRTDEYYGRAAWAGRRALGDGALSNPFAHAVQNALLLAGAERAADLSIELELLRNRPIDADDTACLRVHAPGAPPVVVAVTLCAEQVATPYVVVHGSRGRAVLEYDADRLVVNGHEMRLPPPVDLLDNLVDHRAHGTPLISPLESSSAFTRVVEAVATAAEPVLVDPSRQRVEGSRVVLEGVDEVVVRAAEELATFAELDAPWSREVGVGPRR